MTYYATTADVAGLDPAACADTPCDGNGAPLPGFGYYGYAPVDGLPGKWKCLGFQDRMADWLTPAMLKRYPGPLLLSVGYKGNLCTADEVLAGGAK